MSNTILDEIINGKWESKEMCEKHIKEKILCGMEIIEENVDIIIDYGYDIYEKMNKKKRDVETQTTNDYYDVIETKLKMYGDEIEMQKKTIKSITDLNDELNREIKYLTDDYSNETCSLKNTIKALTEVNNQLTKDINKKTSIIMRMEHNSYGYFS